MKRTPLTTAIIWTTYASAFCAKQSGQAEQQKNNCFEFYVGINSGVSISWYDINKEDAKLTAKVNYNEYNSWNATEIHKTKYLPFIEAELSAQYLTNRVFIDASIAGEAV